MRGAVGIVGLGLIGGSLARDLAARGVRVLGADREARALDAALAAGAVHAPLAGPERAEVDVLVLAVPVLDAPRMLERVVDQVSGSAVLTDVGSTKRSICAAAEARGIGARFVGAHPLAGDHRGGWEASRPGLFRGARVYLTPGHGSSPDAVEAVRGLWETVGGVVETIDAAEHDRLLAWSSHLPQAVSSALAAALAGAGVPRAALGPGGQGVARLAASPSGLWAQIAADNADALGPALEAVAAELRRLGEAVEGGDLERLRAWFAAAGEWSE